MNRYKLLLAVLLAMVSLTFMCFNLPSADQTEIAKLKAGFLNPPDDARPGVYWYFMDGNMSKEAMTADLVINNGIVVTPDAAFPASVAIKDEKIAAAPETMIDTEWKVRLFTKG